MEHRLTGSISCLRGFRHVYRSSPPFYTNVRRHTWTESAAFHTEMIVIRICQVVCVFSCSNGDLILGN